MPTQRSAKIKQFPMVMLDEVLKEANRDGRICPQPTKWNELWEMLPNKKRKGAGWEPALPLILAAWHDTPYLSKISRAHPVGQRQ
jgi:hypothetical protein